MQGGESDQHHSGYTLYPVGSHGRLPSTVLRLRGRITAQQLASQTWSGRTVKFLYDACRPPRPCVRSTAGSDPGPRARSRRGRDARLFMAISGLPRSSRRLSGACARSGCQRPARLRRDARSRRRSHQSSTRPRSSRGLDEESRAGARRVANIPLPERVRRAPWAAGSAGHTWGETMVDRRPRGGYDVIRPAVEGDAVAPPERRRTSRAIRHRAVVGPA